MRVRVRRTGTHPRVFVLWCTVFVAALSACGAQQSFVPTSPVAPVSADYVPRAGNTPSPTIPKPRQIGHPSFAATEDMPEADRTLPDQQSGMSPDDKITNPDGAGQAGYIFEPNFNDGDLYAAMNVHPGLTLPTATNGTANWLYAPTVHGSDGNCLEITTTYFNGNTPPAKTGRWIWLGDFCKNPKHGEFYAQVPMDATFIHDYVRKWKNGDGQGQYIAEEVRMPDRRWHAFFYNATTNKWDDIYASDPGKKSNVRSNEGWAIFETHFEIRNDGSGTPLPKAVACPRVPIIGMSGLRVRSGSNWKQPHIKYDPYEYGECINGTQFVGPPSHRQTRPYYKYDENATPDMRWNVVTK